MEMEYKTNMTFSELWLQALSPENWNCTYVKLTSVSEQLYAYVFRIELEPNVTNINNQVDLEEFL
jgi:hypothetical protein